MSAVVAENLEVEVRRWKDEVTKRRELTWVVRISRSSIESELISFLLSSTGQWSHQPVRGEVRVTKKMESRVTSYCRSRNTSSFVFSTSSTVSFNWEEECGQERRKEDKEPGLYLFWCGIIYWRSFHRNGRCLRGEHLFPSVPWSKSVFQVSHKIEKVRFGQALRCRKYWFHSYRGEELCKIAEDRRMVT